MASASQHFVVVSAIHLEADDPRLADDHDHPGYPRSSDASYSGGPALWRVQRAFVRLQCSHQLRPSGMGAVLGTGTAGSFERHQYGTIYQDWLTRSVGPPHGRHQYARGLGQASALPCPPRDPCDGSIPGKATSILQIFLSPSTIVSSQAVCTLSHNPPLSPRRGGKDWFRHHCLCKPAFQHVTPVWLLWLQTEAVQEVCARGSGGCGASAPREGRARTAHRPIRATLTAAQHHTRPGVGCTAARLAHRRDRKQAPDGFAARSHERQQKILGTNTNFFCIR